MAGPTRLSAEEQTSLDIVTRVSACLSLAGTLFTLTSYLSYRALRKPFNRLAFFIAISNTFGALAYTWGAHPLYHGRNSAFCQTQAFLIQWLVMADPLLVLVMAFSVWYRICAQRSTVEIYLYENIGVGCAFSLPFVPALVFLCWRPNGLTVYGSAVLWCWVSGESKWLRIFAFYAPIWASLLGSIIFFTLTGRQILRTRAQVRKNQSICQYDERPRKLSLASISNWTWRETKRKCSVTSWKQSSSNDTGSGSPRREDSIATPWHATAGAHSTPELLVAPIHTESMSSAVSQSMERSNSDPATYSRRSSRFATMHWKYTRFALLCCLVLLIAWLPISVMRVYNNFINPDHPILGLYYASAVCIPLQGFGNWLVYVTNSWSECRAWVVGLLSGHGLRGRSVSVLDGIDSGNSDARMRDSRTTPDMAHHDDPHDRARSGTVPTMNQHQCPTAVPQPAHSPAVG